MRHLHHVHHHVERQLGVDPAGLNPNRGLGESSPVNKRNPDQPMVYSIVYTTLPQTFDGPASYITQGLPSTDPPKPHHHSAQPTADSSPVEQTSQQPQPQPQTTQQPTQQTPTAQPSPPTTAEASTSKPESSAPAPTSSTHHESSSDSSSEPASTTSQPKSAAQSSESTDPQSSSIAPAYTSPTASTSFQGASESSPAPLTVTSPAESSKDSNSGMSGGAKAGLAFGIIILIGLIAGAAFFLYRRKKQQTKEHEQLEDNEKAAAPAEWARPEHASSIRSTRTASTAPQLSLRPLTQFSPMLGNSNESKNVPVGSKVEMVETGHYVDPAQEGKSLWERPSPSNVNPFGDHAASAAPVAAVAGSAAAGAVAGGVAAAAITSKNDRRRSSDVVPKPLSIKSNASQTSLTSAPSAISEGASSANGSDFQLGTASTAETAVPAAAGAVPAALSAPSGPPSNVHRVQMDFKPSMDDELELRAGQLVRVLHEYDDGWALCIRMDRSRQGVAPRTCLSKLPLKPRPTGPPANGAPRAQGPPPIRPPVGPSSMVPRPLTPTSGRNSPVDPFADRPQLQQPTGGRARSRSNAPTPKRSLSPGAYPDGQRPGDATQTRRRSKSVTDLQPKVYQGPMSPRMPFGHGSTSSMGSNASSIPARKPVGGR
ncbi:MAG: hypothetical protein M1820_002692 [Bogoriella megaspora]|nr:MAG: hypothetical protein M1820_002692 [Bogoriella megaspora]